MTHRSFVIEQDGLSFACRLTERPGSDSLIVLLRANCDRAVESPPVFLEWPESFDGLAHTLRIFDPTLFIADNLQYGNFLGQEAADPLDGVIGITLSMASELRVASDKILFVGVSGGGFAALMCAVRCVGSAALAVNPQLEMGAFAELAEFVRPTADAFRQGRDFVDICRSYPLRTSVSAALSDARSRDLLPRLTLVQNESDRRHHQGHYLPFVQAFGLPATGGSDGSGSLQSVVFDVPGGHVGLPADGLMLDLASHLLAIPAQVKILALELSVARRDLAERSAALQSQIEDLVATRQDLLTRTDELVFTRGELSDRTDELIVTRADLAERTLDLICVRQVLIERTEALNDVLRGSQLLEDANFVRDGRG